jgi:hypothetical protein
MLDNATYNLMETAAQISKGLHRYDTFKTDARGCEVCERLWDEMHGSDEQQLECVVNHLKAHFAHEGNAEAKAA